MKLVGHAARMGELRNVYITLRRMPEEKRLLGKSRCIDGGRIILILIFKKSCVKMWTGFKWHRISVQRR
jgi:hypothetical protein